MDILSIMLDEKDECILAELKKTPEIPQKT